ncbi:hypothetical protein [Streptomyces virginiae]
MGHEVHITRRKNRWDEAGQNISAAEGELAVAVDPGLMAAPMWWNVGRIVSKNPSDVVIARMCRVAKMLDARVQGDVGEYCDA